MMKIADGRVFLLAAALCLRPVLPGSEQQIDGARLGAILKKSAEYCRRLDKAALDFVCIEQVTETTRHYTPSTDVYVYDYQFVRKDGDIKETRNLISVNGQKTNSRDSALHTVTLQYENVLFGPVGLMSEYWQTFHDYELIGEATVNREKTVMIRVTPRPELQEPHPYGIIWVREDDGSVLKIAWDQRSLRNFTSTEEWARANDAEPLITAYSEYFFAKNGLRFPSRSYTEQAYLRKGGWKYANAEISILYRKYKFFTVETEIRY